MFFPRILACIFHFIANVLYEYLFILKSPCNIVLEFYQGYSVSLCGWPSGAPVCVSERMREKGGDIQLASFSWS